MVRNEQDNIVPTMESFIEGGVTKFFIYDTGSTDKTVENAKKWFTDKVLDGSVVIESFVDFATSRNTGLDYGDEKFKDETFMLMIDSEWYMNNLDILLKFCEDNKDDDGKVYYIKVTDGGAKFDHGRLFRIGTDAHFIDPVHEYIGSGFVSNKRVPSDAYLFYRPKHNSEDRWYRDLSLLLKKYKHEKRANPATNEEKEPYIYDNNKGKRQNAYLKYLHEKPPGLDPRTVFYLGQTYDCLNETDQAIKYYLERSKMEGYIEEKFMALYRLGKLHTKSDWETASKYFLEAYSVCPTRAEPLVKLAEHYFVPEIKYMYAKQACSIPQPEHGLFLETSLYEYDRWDQLGWGAWYMPYSNAPSYLNRPFHEEGYIAVQKALAIHPDHTHLIRNMENFQKSLGVDPNNVNFNINNNNNNNNNNTVNTFKILNLILYNTNDKHEEHMREILMEHNKNHNIESYFYCYKLGAKKARLMNGVLYIPGKESYLPGVLEKTLDALKFFKDKKYDYIVRSNISTIVNYNELYKQLKAGELDYGGPLYYVGPLVDLNAGMTKEKHAIYKDHHFVSGICIVFSKTAVKLLVENKKTILSYGIIDDVAIGIFLHDKGLKRKEIGINSCSFDNRIFKPNIIAYRNKCDDRNIDIKNMKMIVSNLKHVKYNI
jgi:hypothetical protein